MGGPLFTGPFWFKTPRAHAVVPKNTPKKGKNLLKKSKFSFAISAKLPIFTM